MTAISIKQASALCGVSVRTLHVRIGKAGINPQYMQGREGMYEREDIEPLMYSVGGVSGKPKGAVTIAEYCEATGLIGWEVRYRARKNKLHKVPGRMLMYMKADLDRIMAEYAEQTTGEDGTRGKCTRCNELDVGMDCRGGLCLDCWSHDYCKRKGI
ncbi:MAG: hypothetical protein WC125_04640 [Bacteroidales bacterium]|jgi:hypothetical protein